MPLVSSFSSGNSEDKYQIGQIRHSLRTNLGNSWEKYGSGYGLPEGYTLLEYVECTGTQYINIGYTPKSENVIYEYSWLEPTANSNCTLFGSTNTSYTTNNNRWAGAHYKPSATSMYSATGITDALCAVSNISVGVKNTAKTIINNGSIERIQNGQSISGTYSGTIQNGINIGLFADIRNSDVIEICTNIRMYYWKMTDNGVLVRNMIPVKNSSGVPGMWDVVGKQFYSSAVTTQLIAGELSDMYKTMYTKVK